MSLAYRTDNGLDFVIDSGAQPAIPTVTISRDMAWVCYAALLFRATKAKALLDGGRFPKADGLMRDIIRDCTDAAAALGVAPAASFTASVEENARKEGAQ